MNWNEMKRKLSSRKFWTAAAGLVSAVLVVMNYSENQITQALGVVSAAGVLIAYILAEGNVDAAREEARNVNKENGSSDALSGSDLLN